MKHLRCDLTGTFGKKKISLDLRLNAGSDTLIILCHGAYGYPYHTRPTKYERLSRILSRYASVGFYQTSRKFLWKEKPKLTFERYRDLSFGNKTFNDEREDVLNAFQNLIEQAKASNVVTVGFSLGAIWPVLLYNHFKELSTIFAFGTGLTFNLPNNLPLFADYPKNKISYLIKRFPGKLISVWGSTDDLVSEKSAYLFFDQAHTARIKQFIVWRGVNHQFTQISGREKESELIKRIIKIIVANL